MNSPGNRIALNAAVGAAAGAVATAALGAVTSTLYEREGRLTRLREDAARGWKTAYEVAAEEAAEAVGVDLSSEQRALAGSAIHWGLGTGAGAIYGVARNHIPLPGPARGLAFGLAFWLVADEGMVPALGLTPGPRAFPWQAHARGLAAHLAFGLVAEGVMAVADRFLDRRPEAGLSEEPSASRWTPAPTP